MQTKLDSMLDLTDIFLEYLQANVGSDGRPIPYEVSAQASDSLDDIRLIITFKRGRRYCCAEAGCHFRFNWQKLSEVMTRHNAELPENVAIHTCVEVESGCDLTSSGPVSSAYQYQTATQVSRREVD